MTSKQSDNYALQRSNAARVAHLDRDDEDLAAQWGRFVPLHTHSTKSNNHINHYEYHECDEFYLILHGSSF